MASDIQTILANFCRNLKKESKIYNILDYRNYVAQKDTCVNKNNQINHDRYA